MDSVVTTPIRVMSAILFIAMPESLKPAAADFLNTRWVRESRRRPVRRVSIAPLGFVYGGILSLVIENGRPLGRK